MPPPKLISGNKLTDHKYCGILEEYFNKPMESCDRVNFECTITNDKDIDTYVTTFNNPNMIYYQIMFHKKLVPEVNLIIADTAGDLHPESSLEVKNLCIKHNVSYIKLPPNLYDSSDIEYGIPDHTNKIGSSYTWIFRNCVKKREPEYFGYLDHDAFPIGEGIYERLATYLDAKNCYGVVPDWHDEERFGGRWNLHVIVNFFKYDFVKDLPLDFRSLDSDYPYGPKLSNRLDTGGSNFPIIYKNLNKEDYRDIDIKCVHVLKETITGGEEDSWINKCRVEFIDNSRWMHLENSNHAPSKKFFDNKFKWFAGFADGIIHGDDYTKIDPRI